MAASYGVKASGNIYPARFLTGTTTDNVLAQATDGSGSHGDPIVAISGRGTHLPIQVGADDGYAATDGDNIPDIVFNNSPAELELGATVVAHQLLKSDANGKGIPATADGDNYGARANQGGISGQKIPVIVIIGQRGAAA